MGMRVEIPPALRGEPQQQLSQISAYLFRLAAGLNVAFDRMSGNTVETPASTGAIMSVSDYTELRDMIGANAKELSKLSKGIKEEVASQLREAEESGDFDGNGISSVVFNADYSITFGFTDGTFFQTPPLKDSPIEIGDIFITTRNGNPNTLLGYGTWELIDKKFAERVITDIENYVTLNTTNCSAVSGRFVINNNEMWANMSFTPAVAVTDSSIPMFTLRLSDLGISSIFGINYSSMSDGGQSVFSYQINANGVFSTTDIIVRGSDTGSLAVGYSLWVNFKIPVLFSNMIDDFCDKFYWKRTA